MHFVVFFDEDKNLQCFQNRVSHQVSGKKKRLEVESRNYNSQQVDCVSYQAATFN